MSELEKYMAEMNDAMDELIRGRPLHAPLDVAAFPDAYKGMAERINRLGGEIADIDRFVQDNSEPGGWRLHQVLGTINQLSLMVLEVALDGGVVYANPVARAYLEERGLTKMPFDDPYRHGALLSYLCMYRGEDDGYVFPVPYELQERDNWFKISTDKVSLSDGSAGYLHTIEDISNYRRNEKQLWQGVMIDALTGAYTRFAGMQKLEELLFTSTVNQKNCIAFVSVEGYEKILEREGKSVADQAVCDMATALRRCLRESDWVVSYGGDEFMLLILDCELEYVDRVFMRLEQSLDHINGTGEKPYLLSYRLGVDELRPYSSSSEDVVEKVRELMHENMVH